MILPAAHGPRVFAEVDGRVSAVAAVVRGALAEVVVEHAKVADAYGAACGVLLSLLWLMFFFVFVVVVVVAWWRGAGDERVTTRQRV